MEEYISLPYDESKVRFLESIYVSRYFTRHHPHVLHQHTDRLELLYIYSGSGQYQVGRREYAVSEGDMVVCSARVLHGEGYAFANDMQTYCGCYDGIHIPPLSENVLLSHEKRPIVTLQTYGPLIRDLMVKIYDMQSGDRLNPVLCSVMAKTVLAMTYYELSEQNRMMDRTPTLKRNETLMRDITEYLDQNYKNDALRMSNLCERFHVSESFLSHAFRKETGLSPKQYIIQRRIGEAQSLLENSRKSIGEIETELGFSSSVHFSATFRKYVGMSPREYRKYYRK